MGINFPSTPSVNQLHPDPATAGLPQYKWDGTAWVAVATPEALTYVKRPGDTMTGLLRLSGDPVHELDAVPRRWAAPLDALAYNGIQINGSMEVSQQFDTPSNIPVNNSAVHINDGWIAALIGLGGTGSAGQVATSVIGPLSGFPQCMSIVTGSSHAMANAGDAAYLHQNIEGIRWARLGWGVINPLPVTISFWVHPAITGTMAVTLRNIGGGVSYVADVPVTAGVWQFKSVIIPAPTIGTWPGSVITAAATLNFCFGANSNLKTSSPNTWVTGNYIATNSTTNFFATVNNATRVTGVSILPGAITLSAAYSSLVMRPYDQELRTCQRYFYKRVHQSGTWFATLQAYAVSSASGPVFSFPVTMRAAPSALASGSLIVANAAGGAGVVSVGTYTATTDLLMVNGIGSGTVSFTPGDAVLIGPSGSGVSHILDARL